MVYTILFCPAGKIYIDKPIIYKCNYDLIYKFFLHPLVSFSVFHGFKLY